MRARSGNHPGLKIIAFFDLKPTHIFMDGH